jgi:AhpD family alkylhydroperoxidase
MQNLDPYAISPKEMQELISLHAFLDSSGLDESLIELLRLNVSRLNGCEQGVRRHSRRAWLLGEQSARLAALATWQGSALFTEKERAALEWSEVVTLASRPRSPELLHASTQQWFTDIEIVKLTLVAAVTTAWNQVELALSDRDSQVENVQRAS